MDDTYLKSISKDDFHPDRANRRIGAALVGSHFALNHAMWMELAFGVSGYSGFVIFWERRGSLI